MKAAAYHLKCGSHIYQQICDDIRCNLEADFIGAESGVFVFLDDDVGIYPLGNRLGRNVAAGLPIGILQHGVFDNQTAFLDACLLKEFC